MRDNFEILKKIKFEEELLLKFENEIRLSVRIIFKIQIATVIEFKFKSQNLVSFLVLFKFFNKLQEIIFLRILSHKFLTENPCQI